MTNKLTFTLGSEEPWRTSIALVARKIRLTEADALILGTDLLSSSLLIAGAQGAHLELLALATGHHLGEVAILAVVALEARVAGATQALARDDVTVEAGLAGATPALAAVGEAKVAVDAPCNVQEPHVI